MTRQWLTLGIWLERGADVRAERAPKFKDQPRGRFEVQGGGRKEGCHKGP